MRQLRLYKIRNASDIPFYCKPLHLFFAQWALMLTVFQLRISYTSYPDLGLAVLLFVISALAFLGGYMTIRFAYEALGQRTARGEFYYVNLSRLRRFHLLAVGGAVAIILMNLKLHGFPPIFGVFGVDTLGYQEYGSFDQPLFTAILVVFVSAPLETSSWRRWALYLFGPAAFLIYGSRGYLLIMLFQALVVFSLRTRLSKSKIYTVAAATLLAAVLLSDLIGNNRNSLGVEALLGFLQIKREYYNWPSANLWVISYIATPFSNLCWIVHVYSYHGPTFRFLYSALPGFLAPTETLQATDLGTEKIVDGVHTYMAKYFLDFWYFGILGINYIWGLIAGYLASGNRLTRNFLVSAVLLGCMAFMFFSDFLTILIILLEMASLALVQRYVVRPAVQEEANI
jgi:oligosaccharide repeat unit polymerase